MRSRRKGITSKRVREVNLATRRVNGLDLFYYDDNFSDPWKPTQTVFMLHGFGRNANFWRAWVPTLARGYRVIRADIRGCGQSEDPGPDFVFEIDDVVSDFIGLLDALGVDAVHYVGDATGGIVGVLVAARHPERILTLTLISTPTRPSTGDPKNYMSGFGTPQIAMETLGMKEYWLQTSRTLDDPAQAEYFADEVARTPVHCAATMWNYMHGPKVDTTSVLSAVKAPTLVLSPTQVFSGNVTPEQQREMISHLPNARQKTYDGHPIDMLCMLPDELAKDTLDFIDSIRLAS
jgi:pimeloyl-ACP methyl ester carboxylesterase